LIHCCPFKCKTEHDRDQDRGGRGRVQRPSSDFAAGWRGTAGRDNNRRSRAASLKSWPEVRLRGPPARQCDGSGLCETGNANPILTSPIKVTS
jgi:hypothetical protein